MRRSISFDIFVNLYREHGSALTWGEYAERISSAQNLTGSNKFSAKSVENFARRNHERLKARGINIQWTRQEINRDLFVSLYREHGESWTWHQYADRLSELQGRTGDDRFKSTSLTAMIRRDRRKFEEMGLKIKPRRVSAKDVFIWPNMDRAAHRNTRLWRYLERLSRVQMLGIESIEYERGTRRDFEVQHEKYIKQKLVIRYDPGRGLYTDRAHEDEIPGGPEKIEYYFQRNSKKA